jgi:hypothetical protein
MGTVLMALTDATATLLSRGSFPLTVGSTFLCRTLHARVSSRAVSKADFSHCRILMRLQSTGCSLPPLSSPMLPALMCGGDFIGLSATIDHRDGALRPVPEHLVPQKLIRWGQAPTCLQVLVSEDGDDKTTGNATTAYWSRQTLTVFPETDCGVENLQTKRSVDEVETSRILRSLDSSVRVLTHGEVHNTHHQPRRMTVESTFGWFDEHRVRLVVKVDIDLAPATACNATNFHITTPVQVVLERQIGTTRGSAIGEPGGGLDSQQLTMWMGQILPKYSSFAEHGSPGVWKTNATGDSPFDVPTLVLPGNLTISSWYSDKAWIIEMGHVFPHQRLRKVVTIQFFSPPECEITTRVETGEFVAKV